MATYSDYSDVAQTTTWTTEFKAVYDAMSTKPLASISFAQNAIIATLKAGGIWTKLDIFYLFATNIETNSLINWKNPGTNNAVNNHSTAFAAYEGFTGDGSADYISINGLHFAVGTWNFKQDSAMVYALSLKSVAAVIRTLFGYENAGVSVLCIPFKATNTFRGRCNGSTDSEITTSTNSIGHYLVNRSNSTTVTINKNKTKLTNSLSNSTGLAATIDILRRYSSADLYGAYTVSCFACGGSLNATEQDALIDAVEAYMDTNGKGVL